MNNQHLTIRNLGPIKKCEIDLTRMMVLDGLQAAGKSTIAKTIFFFRTIKNDIVDLILNPYIDNIKSEIPIQLHKKFIQMFGDDNAENLLVSFYYAKNVEVEIFSSSASVKVSDTVFQWIEGLKYFNFTLNDKPKLLNDIEKVFADNKDIVYIPAGRSMLSILSEPLSHIFFNFDDAQKNMIDYCTSDYINRVTKIKPAFKSYEKLFSREHTKNFGDLFFPLIQDKMGHILQGKYSYMDGEEFLQLFGDNRKFIPIKFTSSGQQEVLWILNLIYYYLMKSKPTCFIIEEPEAHLYPDTQKEIAEYIALALSDKNECIITTHSPYILGTFSNLLDAFRLMSEGYNISGLLEQEFLTSYQLLDSKEFSAYFVSSGELENAVDEENGLIKNELIDGASDKINGFADDLMYLERKGKI